MRKFLALALAVVMMVALIPTAMAAPTVVNTAPTFQFNFDANPSVWSAGTDLRNSNGAYTAEGQNGWLVNNRNGVGVGKLGWASSQNIDGFYAQLVDWNGSSFNAVTGAYGAFETLKIDAQYSKIETRGNDYSKYIDIPLNLQVRPGYFTATPSFTGTGKLAVTIAGSTTNLDIAFNTSGSSTSEFNLAPYYVRFYPQANGNSATITLSYSDPNTSSTSSFWTVGGSANSLTSKLNIVYVDRNSATMGVNAIAPAAVGTNANRAKAVWDPDTAAVRVYADFPNFVAQKIYNINDGRNYFVMDIKCQLLKEGVPYPANTPVSIDISETKGTIVNPQNSAQWMVKDSDYWTKIIWENDREGYLSADGSFTLRFYYTEYNVTNSNQPTTGNTAGVLTDGVKNNDILKRIGNVELVRPRLYISEGNGVYNEKYFWMLMSYSYQISTGGISIPGGDFSMQIGATKQLSVLYNDNTTLDQKIEWTSSDASVASVSSTGLVTAVKNGTAVIKARTSVEGKEAFVIVTVADPAPVVVAPTTTKYTVVCSSLNKRIGAGTGFKKVSPTLKRGDIVEVIEVVGGWAKYEIGGVAYWSSLGDGRYLQPTP